MGNRIIVIGDHDMALGFSLVGLRDCVSATMQTSEAELDRAFSAQDAGMIILLEDFLQQMSQKMKRRVEAATKPVVVTIPGKGGPSAQGGDLAQMIKKAIGVELKA
jgi:vacuolar-type H+-ATPase subunit F/Vma7